MWDGTDGAGGNPTFVYVIGRVGQGLRRELQKLLADWDLSVPEYTALSVLQARPGLSNAQLARRSLMTPQSMNRIVAALEQRKLLQRAVDIDHNRILRAEVTRSGRVLLEAVAPAVAAFENEMMSAVSPEHREVMLDGLIDCMSALSSARARSGR